MIYDDKKTPGAPALLDIGALLAAGAAQGSIKRESGFRPIVLVPDGYTTEALEFAQPEPLKDFIDQTVELKTLESFAAYVKRYQSSTTVVFADVTDTGAKFTAIFDYHAAAKDGDEVAKPGNNTATGINALASTSQPRRTAHRAIYGCPHSYEWRQWSEKNGKAQGQEDFARFIDSNSVDVVNPDSASLLELALNFQMKSNVDFSSDIVRQSGARALKYTETISATGGQTPGSISVPEEITLKLPVFHGGKLVELKAKLFYRAPGGKLSISYEVRRPHEAVQAAITDVVADITAQIGIAPFVGGIALR